MNHKNQILLAAMLLTASLKPCLADVVIDLKNGVITDTKAVPAQAIFPANYTSQYISVTLQKSATCKETPYEALVTVNLKPALAVAVQEMKVMGVEVTFEGPTTGAPTLPSGWVTHIGDDPANDGFGGGTTADGGIAEVHITNQKLLVYSSALDVGVVENLLQQDLQPATGSIYFEAGNQWLSWGNPYNEIDSAATKKLFQIPDKYGDYKLYAAFNRVISNRADRKGCGARRAVISVR